MSAADVAVVEGEGVASCCGFPTKSSLGEPALPALLGEIEVNVVEALTDCGAPTASA